MYENLRYAPAAHIDTKDDKAEAWARMILPVSAHTPPVLQNFVQ